GRGALGGARDGRPGGDRSGLPELPVIRSGLHDRADRAGLCRRAGPVAADRAVPRGGYRTALSGQEKPGTTCSPPEIRKAAWRKVGGGSTRRQRATGRI